MKKFFDEYPVSVLLAMFIFFAPLVYWIAVMAISMIADSGDPALVLIVLSLVIFVGMFLLTPVAYIVVPALTIAFEIIGWLVKKTFSGIRHLINRHSRNSA